MPLSSLRRTFTLIEMLIVIVIIGILAAALIPRLNDLQGRARDSKRKVDLRTIYNANEIYITDHGKYAPTIGVINYYSTWGSAWIPTLTGILANIPVDPINNGIYNTTGNFTYRYGNHFSWDINSYDLTTRLENIKDPQNCINIQRTYYYPTTWCVWAGISYNISHYINYLYEYSPHSWRF